MLSPKMQRTIRVNDSQLIMLSERAHYDHSYSGYLHKRSSDSTKWQLRWFILYQNLLFYYDSEHSHRPSGVIMLEGCYCERLISPSTKNKDSSDKQPEESEPIEVRENVRLYYLTSGMFLYIN
ncbi:hypothetical protein GE061_013400 [Apolygus lucorum]|uniref:PH domain-containing protein n=1 Tax=Apolygus lucorum TaxID=248454 RepID=A0A8S9XQH3_APOLU|nr:hypothetical protein GE061_013400 [Apolygus lucorum]